MSTPRASTPRASTPRAQRIVGKYELGRTIGIGTFAKVRFARHTETGEHVAIKILDKEKVLKHKLVEQIKREIATMKLIKHPNVVRLHEVMGSRTKIFIVLEYITGGELFDKIVNHGRMGEDEARGYFHQLINAVDFCHSRGVYHRDLKAKCAFSPSQGQVFTDVVGSPYYVTPEVLCKHYGPEADVWTTEVILYILLSGVPPFWAETQQGIFDAVLKGDIDFESDPWPLISDSAKDLIRKMLSSRPSDRLTAHEVLCRNSSMHGLHEAHLYQMSGWSH